MAKDFDSPWGKYDADANRTQIDQASLDARNADNDYFDKNKQKDPNADKPKKGILGIFGGGKRDRTGE
jgi:hypothetical protein